MNSKSLVNKQKQKQTTKRNIYMKIEFQNSVARLSFLCHIKGIKIAWMNPWQCNHDGKLQMMLKKQFLSLFRHKYWTHI